MDKILPNGTLVLIFYYNLGNYPQNMGETTFIKGVIIDSCEDLTLRERIYTVLGEDGKQYRTTYNTALIHSFFIRTVDEQILNIEHALEENQKTIDKLYFERKILKDTIDILNNYDNKKETKIKRK